MLKPETCVKLYIIKTWIISSYNMMICDNIKLNSTLYLRIKKKTVWIQGWWVGVTGIWRIYTVLLRSTFVLRHGSILQLLNTFPLWHGILLLCFHKIRCDENYLKWPKKIIWGVTCFVLSVGFTSSLTLVGKRSSWPSLQSISRGWWWPFGFITRRVVCFVSVHTTCGNYRGLDSFCWHTTK